MATRVRPYLRSLTRASRPTRSPHASACSSGYSTTTSAPSAMSGHAAMVGRSSAYVTCWYGGHTETNWNGPPKTASGFCAAEARERKSSTRHWWTDVTSLNPVMSRLGDMQFSITHGSSSTIVEAAHPRDIASIATFPVPAYRSSQRLPSGKRKLDPVPSQARSWLNTAPFTTAIIGRVAWLVGECSSIRRAEPATTRSFLCTFTLAFFAPDSTSARLPSLALTDASPSAPAESALSRACSSSRMSLEALSMMDVSTLARKSSPLAAALSPVPEPPQLDSKPWSPSTLKSSSSSSSSHAPSSHASAS
mmetsp:Transcript_4862/g.16823  ORF Transcript_4862/g.16823 Transcript_4862/m.16823 type:complete len:307 (-) Transcript_4862:1963-2883(-)